MCAALCLTLATSASAKTIRVSVGQSVQAALDGAADDDVVELAAGTHRERVVVRRRVTLTGKGATLDGGGQGTVVRVEAARAVVEELSLRGSGRDLGASDACIYVAKSATGATVRAVTIAASGFGVWVHETEGAKILDSKITGSLEGNRPERGNAIHLFDGSHLVIRGNRIFGGRDGVYVSATDDSVIEDNWMEQTRYGVHYMYSHRNVVRRNHATKNFSGYALMLSDHIEATDNEAIGNSEHGFLLRDVSECKISNNRSSDNAMGLFFYGSTENELTDNLIFGNAIGAKIWGGSVRNRVAGNAFIGNRTQVFYVASEDLVLGAAGRGNYWSDYLGWDQNGDGLGDRPHRVDSFTTRLLYRFPSAVLLLRSPALELLSHLEERLPLMRTPTVIDQHPLVRTTLR